MKIDVVHTNRYRVGKNCYEIQYIADFKKVKDEEVQEGVCGGTSFIFRGVKEVTKILDLTTEEVVKGDSKLGKVLLTRLDVCACDLVRVANEYRQCFDSEMLCEN